MNRKEFINNIFAQIKATSTSKTRKEVLLIVMNFKKENGLFLSDIIPLVVDGFLYLNDQPIERIASRSPKMSFTDRGYYLEGRCIHA